MTHDDRPSDDDLAHELRALAATLHETATDDARRATALAHLRDARTLLAEGQRRLRWYEVDEIADGSRARTRDLSPWSGALNAIAPPIRIERGVRDGEPCMIGRVEITRLREGPANGVHGGVMAGLFDEMLAAGVGLTDGPPALTGRLTIRYRRITPIDTDLVFRSWVERARPMRVDMRAECLRADDLHAERPRPTAEASAIFVRRR